ncbi:MAG: HTTM domain-containing protein [Pirellulales bacterium]
MPPRHAWWTALWSVDLRALAAVRIGCGLLLLADLANRWPDLAAHYSDVGLLTRADRWNLLVDFGLSGWTSLHMLSGSVWFQGLLFCLTAAAALLLLLGYRTRLASVACFLLLLSLHARNPLVLQCGDTLLRCLLFWCMFLPWGEVWSVDAWHRPRPADLRYCSTATVALLLQLCYVYVFTALLKTDPSWRSDFSAIHYALHHDHFTTAWGYRLLQYPKLLPPMTLASWLLEWAGPLLLFCPIGMGRIRTAIVASFVGFHLGLAATMELGLFPFYCICYWLVFLPRGVWDKVEDFCRGLARRERINVTPIHATLAFDRHWLRDCVVLFLLCYVTLLNVRRLDGDWFGTIGQGPWKYTARATGLDQCWCMFATGPHEFGGWLEIRGTLSDGRRVNLWSPSDPLPQAKPLLVSGMYSSHRWRRYLLYLHELPDDVQRRAVAVYFRRRWNELLPAELTVATVELVHMVDPTPRPGTSERLPLQTIVLYRWDYRTW